MQCLPSSGSMGVGGGQGTMPVKNSHKKMAAEHGGLYLMFLAPPPPKFLDPLLLPLSPLSRLHRHTQTHIHTQHTSFPACASKAFIYVSNQSPWEQKVPISPQYCLLLDLKRIFPSANFSLWGNLMKIFPIILTH